MALREAIASRDSQVLVADASGELVGFCTAYFDMHSVRFGHRVWVEDLAVHPTGDRQGVGKALLDAAKGWARERGATHLELDSAETRATPTASTSASARAGARSASPGSCD